MERYLDHDMGLRAAVADVVESGSGATLLGDGRAPDLPEWNHAARLRAGSADPDGLLDRLTAWFDKRKRPPAFALDPDARPADLPARLAARGFTPRTPDDLWVWDPAAPVLNTSLAVYMTMATNATLDEWLRIATCDLPEPQASQARTMLGLCYRVPGVSYWFGQYRGFPAGAGAIYVRDGISQAGPVWVLPEHRGNGVGLALMQFVTRQGRKDGAQETYLLNPQGGPATSLCRTVGYRLATEAARTMWTRGG